MLDKPHCLDARIFNEKLVGIEIQNVKLLLTKPSSVGFVVLELSKLHMLKYVHPNTIHLTYCIAHFPIFIYHPLNEFIIELTLFHCDVIKVRYWEKAHLLLTDTDSVMYHIEIRDVYKEMVEMKVHFHMSNFEPNSTCYQPGFAARKAGVAKRMDMVAGCPILAFVGQRPKMY